MVDDDSTILRCGELSSSTCSSPQSPHAMAEAAVASAMLAEDERNAVDEKRRRSSTEEALHVSKRQSRGYNSGSTKEATVSATRNDDCRGQECSNSAGGSSSCIAGIHEEKEDFCTNKSSNALSFVKSAEGKSASSRNSSSGEDEEYEDDLKLIGQVWDEFTQEYFINSDGCTTREEAKEAMLEAINDIILGKVIDTLMQKGIEAFKELDIITGDAMTLNRMLDARQGELRRLNELESESRTSLTVRISLLLGISSLIHCICFVHIFIPLHAAVTETFM